GASTTSTWRPARTSRRPCSPSSPAERKRRCDRRPSAGRARDRELAVHRFDPVAKSLETAVRVDLRAAGPVVGHGDPKLAVDDLADLGQSGAELVLRDEKHVSGRRRIRLELTRDDVQAQARVDEPLLRAVVEVALESAALLVAGVDHAGARVAQLALRLVPL